MKIAFRPSGGSSKGGRGEYELAGSQGKISATDLADYDIDFQVSPNILVPGKCILRIKNGKPRLRLQKLDKDEAHIQRWLSAILLLPEPNRTLTAAGYQITNIQVDIASLSGQHGLLRPTSIEIKQAETSNFLSVPERIGRVQAILENFRLLPDDIQQTVGQYRETLARPTSHAALEHSRDVVYSSLTKHGYGFKDALDSLEYIIEEQGRAIAKPEAKPPLPKQHAEEDNRTAIEIRSDYLRAWRLVAERGSQGRLFSKGVVEAYNYRCILSGFRLPKTSVNPIPGVDAAHILPWSKYDLNQVSNGLCLTRTCHWAFDSGILKVFFDRSENCYAVTIEASIRKILDQAACDLSMFDSCLGKIPESRLPEPKYLWPNPDFLDEFNKNFLVDTL